MLVEDRPTLILVDETDEDDEELGAVRAKLEGNPNYRPVRGVRDIARAVREILGPRRSPWAAGRSFGELQLVAHGSPGQLAFGGRNTLEDDMLSASGRGLFELEGLAEYCDDDSKVLLLGCNLTDRAVRLPFGIALAARLEVMLECAIQLSSVPLRSSDFGPQGLRPEIRSHLLAREVGDDGRSCYERVEKGVRAGPRRFERREEALPMMPDPAPQGRASLPGAAAPEVQLEEAVLRSVSTLLLEKSGPAQRLTFAPRPELWIELDLGKKAPLRIGILADFASAVLVFEGREAFLLPDVLPDELRRAVRTLWTDLNRRSPTPRR